MVNDRGDPITKWKTLRQGEREPRHPEPFAGGNDCKVNVPDVIRIPRDDGFPGCVLRRGWVGGCDKRIGFPWRGLDEPSCRGGCEIEAAAVTMLREKRVSPQVETM